MPCRGAELSPFSFPTLISCVVLRFLSGPCLGLSEGMAARRHSHLEWGRSWAKRLTFSLSSISSSAPQYMIVSCWMFGMSLLTE